MLKSLNNINDKSNNTSNTQQLHVRVPYMNALANSHKALLIYSICALTANDCVIVQKFISKLTGKYNRLFDRMEGKLVNRRR